jgi:hypothetical protein
VKNKSVNLLDLISDDDKSKIELFQKGDNKNEHITPEVMIIAEFGYYYGWQSIIDIKRGYIEKFKDNGDIDRVPFLLEEVYALLEAARKVWAKQVLDIGTANLSANAAVYAKSPGKSFEKSMKQFIKESRI